MVDRHVDGFAELNWLSESEGGRKSFPTGKYYAANIRFEGEENLWSIMIFFLDEDHREMQKQVVGIVILFRENLKIDLAIGRHFLIFEGTDRLVAVGKMISLNK